MMNSFRSPFEGGTSSKPDGKRVDRETVSGTYQRKEPLSGERHAARSAQDPLEAAWRNWRTPSPASEQAPYQVENNHLAGLQQQLRADLRRAESALWRASSRLEQIESAAFKGEGFDYDAWNKIRYETGELAEVMHHLQKQLQRFAPAA